jgi:beta-galactosidase beta subunit
MIFDCLANAHLYLPLGQGLGRALEYLRQTDLAALEPGRYEIDGANV